MRYPFDRFSLGTGYGVKGSQWASGFHSGADFRSTAVGGDGRIYPLYAGVVQKVTTGGSYGNCVYIKHPDGYVTLYAHMKTVYVKVGQQVTENTCLGIEGSTGNSTGVHCHVEVHKGDYHYPSDIDPVQFIEQRMAAERLTQEQFNAMMNNYMAELAKKEPQAWSRTARIWAEENGLIMGNGTSMAYQSPVTREELVTILYRYNRLIQSEI